MTQEEIGKTTLGWTIGAISYLTSMNVDLALGILLKLLSIISVSFVIIVNLPKVVNTFREWLHKK